MKYKKQQTAEAIAIVSMAFRFPGDVCDEQSFWNVLQNGRDVVSQIGNERWAVEELHHSKRSEPGRSITFSAGTLSRVREFDASFFGISPREAAWLDPQQRLLLELAWEAMENGGQVPDQLAGSDSAVYVGISSLDYGVRGIADLASISSHSMTGNTLSIAANRISYIFDLHGPSLSVDTACSSSLVALHQACKTLQTGEASMALVGSVNMLLHPYPFVGFTKASMISGNGRCRAFDASADGYVRAEGGAMLLLKPLSLAEAAGDPIHAIILGSGVNADGGRKTGITIPSSEGQAELMRRVLGSTKIDPSEVDYIEAHGTGTAVGDPVEAKAIGEVYGQRRDTPLPIGSVKTNLGHLEAASGMAGLIKTVLMLKHQKLAPSLHFVAPNPQIPFESLNLRVVTQYASLAKLEKQAAIMAVNSFGFGGTNAHVLLKSYLPRTRATRKAPKTFPPLFLSAQTPEALQALAWRYADFLQNPDAPNYYDVAYSAALHRQQLQKRLALCVTDTHKAATLLKRFSQKEPVPEIVQESAFVDPGAIAFIYSGNGTHWAGMGQKLLLESSRFAQLMQELDDVMAPAAGFSILDEIRTENQYSRLDDTAIVQPILFAMQVAITTLLREQGVKAVAVAGHSVGEVAAAWAAGALTLKQAIDVVCKRSAAQAKTRGCGRMAAVGLSEKAMLDVLHTEHYSTIEIAGINSPYNVTLSGSLEELEGLKKKLEAKNIFFRLLDLDYAFHSRSMDAVKKVFLRHLGSVKPTMSSIDFVSTVTGNIVDGTGLDKAYWWDNVRKPVLFAGAIETLITRGCRIFVEVGPHAILQRYMKECLDAAKVTGRVLPTLLRGDDSKLRIDNTALALHVLEYKPDLKTYFPQKGRFVQLPNYPWQREDYWLPKTSEGYSLITRKRVHPLLGWRLKEAEASWENVIDPTEYAYLSDHCISGAIVFPASAYAEIALAAAQQWFGGNTFELEELEIVSPIVFDAEHARSLYVELMPHDGRLRISSRERLSKDKWSLHATCRLLGHPTRPASSKHTHSPSKDSVTIEAVTHYRLAHKVGLEYGPNFQGFVSATSDADHLCGQLALPDTLNYNSNHYLLHPVLLDSCFQALVNFFRTDIEAGRGLQLLPVKIGRMRIFGDARPTHFEVQLKKRGTRSVRADFILSDVTGQAVCEIEGCIFRVSPMMRKKDLSPARWRINTRLIPHPIDSRVAGCADNDNWAQKARDWFARNDVDLHRRRYFQDGLPLLNALVVAFIYEAFCQLNSQHTTWLQHALGDTHSVPAEHHNFFLWLVWTMKQSMLLKEVEGVWQLDETHAPPPAEEIWCTLLAEFPGILPELLFIGRIGQHLPALLSGRLDTQALMHSIDKSPLLDTLFDTALPYAGINHALQDVLGDIAGTWPKNRRLRILHMCAGHSDLPAHLAKHLPAVQIDYVIAEADPERLGRFKADYQPYDFITVAALQTEDMSLSADRVLPHAYDVVIVQHWLYRAANPASALALLRRNMALGGQMVIAERYSNYASDFIFGLEKTWWRGINDNYASSLQDPPAWKMLLVSQGFENIEIVSEPADQVTKGSAYLLFARNAQASAAQSKPAAAHWLLLCDTAEPAHALNEQLAFQLESSGQRVTRAGIGQDAESVSATLKEIEQEHGQIHHVVYLKGMHGQSAAPVIDINSMQHSRCIGALHLLQALTANNIGQPRLWLVTSGGALVSDGEHQWNIHPQEAQLWGLGRVVMNEYPALSCTLIDINFNAKPAQTAERLLNELLLPDGESEIVLTADARFGLRMEHDTSVASGQTEYLSQFRLDFQVSGQLRNLLWVPQAELTLGADEIEVQPAAVGLNFRDVMYAMGLLPDEAVENGFSGASLGLEFAGTVSRVGAGVSEYKTGDHVLGFGPACFSSHVVTKANAVIRKPDGWSFAQAATVPTAFFTVYYALKHLANVQPGERVLIHGAAGGVGIAAIQLAQTLGAEIFATAGSDEKRDFIKLLGADHVLDSRSLAFADDILALTNNEGVDVVLNSLAGEAINRNLRALKPFGRFLELGKRDFFENTHIGLRPFKDNISYFGIDADQLLISRPELSFRLFREVMQLFQDGRLSPLPYRVYPAERVIEAFRHMQQSRHIGKIVVDLQYARVPVIKAAENSLPLSFHADATYMVTGGVTGFGLESARWLAEHGAKHLVLVSRRGMNTPDAVQAIADLEALGANVHVFACDITRHNEIKKLFSIIEDSLPPLRGIIHAAMALDDSIIKNLDEQRFRKVLEPKVLGAWNLHNQSLTLPLDHFIMYSSVTTYIGNPGQSNYVAANAYLEAFAAWRRSLGLVATCISWGPISDTGYLARNSAIKESLTARLGAKPLESKQALSMLEQMLRTNIDQVAIADFDFASLSRLLPSASGSRFILLHHPGNSAESGDESSANILQLIVGKSPAEVHTIIQAIILTEAGKILSVSPERIDPSLPLQELGMDSLMTVELALAIEQRFGIQLPAMELGEESKTLDRISMRIVEKLINIDTDEKSDSLVDMVSRMAAQHAEEFSPEDVSQTAQEVERLTHKSRGNVA